MTLKCDVYSFGVVLLETLSGQRNGPMYSLLPHVSITIYYTKSPNIHIHLD